jgi:hypothetical protein
VRAVDSHDIRDWMTKIRLKSYARAGSAVSANEVERQVVADCELADAARRAGDIGTGGGTLSKDARRPGSKPEDHDGIPERAAESRGLKLAGGGKYDRYSLIHGDPTKVSEKWAKACGRMKRIAETANTSTSDLAKAVDTAELGPLVVEVAELWSSWMLRSEPPPKHGIDRNPFRGMRTRDALRKFETLAYAICDRSTGKLGHWYVK